MLKEQLADKYSYLKDSLRQAMRDEGIRAVIAVSPENVRHTAGVYIASQRMIRERLATAIYPLDGTPCFVVSSVVAKTARTQSWIEDIVAWQEHDTTPVEALIVELKRRGLDHGRLWLEMCYLAATYFLQLQAALPNVQWVDAELLLDRSRMRKTPNEITLMQRNAIAAEKAIYAGFMFARVGTTEREIAQRMVSSLIDLGADSVPFMILAAGREHALNERHPVPGAKRLEPGDLIIVALVGMFRGYYTGYGRMASVGPPSARQRQLYDEIVQVQRRVAADLRPGVRADELYQRAGRYAREAGFELSINWIGHSIGLGLHEYPNITASTDAVLQAGMTVTIEIHRSDPEVGRFYIEDLFAIEDGPTRRLTDYFNTDRMYEIRI